MKKHSGVYYSLSLLLILLLAAGALPHYATAAQEQDHNARASEREDDHCDQLPDPPGQAIGIEKRCHLTGSSSGIAKGDFNGDGFADLAIGVPDEDIGTIVDAGAVNVVYGSPDGLTASATATAPNVPDAQFWSLGATGVPGTPETGDRFGEALAAGDFNGDGFSDLAIGIPHKSVTTFGLFGSATVHKDSGAVLIVYGGPNGLSIAGNPQPGRPGLGPQLFDLDFLSRNYTLCPIGCNFLLDGAHFGESLAWGNFNGDKFSGVIPVADLAIGIPHYTFSSIVATIPNQGAVFVLFGTTGSGLLGGTLIDIVTASDASDLFGAALAAGDFNGDGFSDLAVGAPGVQIGTAAAAGQVLVFNGDVQNISRTASVAVSQASPGILGSTAEENDRFGLALAAGDFDGDGKSDLAIGVPREDFGSVINVGIVHVLYGTSSVAAGLSLNRNQFFLASTLGETDEGGAQFGKTLAAGDFNGDGKADLAIGVPLKDVAGVSDAGQVHVIYGSGSGLSTFLTRSPQIWRQTTSGVGLTAEAGDRFGSSLTAWNFGHTAELGVARPATADLAIGIPFKDVGTHSDAGAVLVLYGCFTCNGLIAGFNQLWTQVPLPGGPEKDDHFGSALY